VLVLALLVGVTASCAGTQGGGDVDVTPTVRTNIDAHIGKDFTSDSTRIGNISNDFGPNETVFAVVDVPGKIEGAINIRWMYGESETVLEQTVPIQEGIHAYRFRLDPAAGGHRVGDYRFEVYLNNNRAESESFKVKAG
jgi:hypothetical protein